jgi:hypothetical protein
MKQVLLAFRIHYNAQEIHHRIQALCEPNLSSIGLLNFFTAEYSPV